MKFGFSILIVHLGWFLVGWSFRLFLFCVGTGDNRTVYKVGVQLVHILFGTRDTAVVCVIAGDTSTFAHRRRVVNFNINLAIDLHRNGFIVQIIDAHVFDFFFLSGTFLVTTRGVPSHDSSLGMELMSKRVQFLGIPLRRAWFLLGIPLAHLLVSLGNREIPLQLGRILGSRKQFFAIGKFHRSFHPWE
jgi:hypothetical protein